MTPFRAAIRVAHPPQVDESMSDQATPQDGDSAPAATSSDAANTLVERLVAHYPGQTASAHLWRWSEQADNDWQWRGDSSATWETLLTEHPASWLLIQQALFDHPGDEVYRAALPPIDEQRPAAQQVALLLACLDACPDADRPFRLGQWLPLCSDGEAFDAFLAAVPAMQGRWTNGERSAADAQFAALADGEGADFPSLDGVAQGAIALLQILHELAESPVQPPPWQRDVDQLHRLFARLISCELRVTEKPDDAEAAGERALAVSDLLTQAPDLITAIDASLSAHGAPSVAGLLQSALARTQQTLAEQPAAIPVDLLEGMRQALWATTGSETASAATYTATITDTIGAR